MKKRSLFISLCGFMESMKSSNPLTSLQFLKNSLLAYSAPLFQCLKFLLFFPLVRVSAVGRRWIPFLCVFFSITAVYGSTVETLVAAGCSRFSDGLDSSLSYSRSSNSLTFFGYLPIGGDLRLMWRHMKKKKKLIFLMRTNKKITRL